jgi:hypothetical protein
MAWVLECSFLCPLPDRHASRPIQLRFGRLFGATVTDITTRQEDVDELIRAPWEAAIAASDLEPWIQEQASGVDAYVKDSLKEPKIDEAAFKEGLKI